MSIADIIISSIAPFHCLACSAAGRLLCEDCETAYLEVAPSRCYRCHAVTMQHQVCSNCRKVSRLQHAWVTSIYQGISKQLVEVFKFERAQGAAKELANIMERKLPILPENTVIVYVPTSSHRRRIRGYDQAYLLAKQLARLRGLPCLSVIERASGSRQLGASRIERQKQAEDAFRLRNKVGLGGKNVLIVDDITTTGASLEVIARLCKAGGAARVDAIVFAQAI